LHSFDLVPGYSVAKMNHACQVPMAKYMVVITVIFKEV